MDTNSRIVAVKPGMGFVSIRILHPRAPLPAGPTHSSLVSMSVGKWFPLETSRLRTPPATRLLPHTHEPAIPPRHAHPPHARRRPFFPRARGFRRGVHLHRAGAGRAGFRRAGRVCGRGLRGAGHCAGRGEISHRRLEQRTAGNRGGRGKNGGAGGAARRGEGRLQRQRLEGRDRRRAGQSDRR